MIGSLGVSYCCRSEKKGTKEILWKISVEIQVSKEVLNRSVTVFLSRQVDLPTFFFFFQFFGDSPVLNVFGIFCMRKRIIF